MPIKRFAGNPTVKKIVKSLPYVSAGIDLATIGTAEDKPKAIRQLASEAMILSGNPTAMVGGLLLHDFDRGVAQGGLEGKENELALRDAADQIGSEELVRLKNKLESQGKSLNEFIE